MESVVREMKVTMAWLKICKALYGLTQTEQDDLFDLEFACSCIERRHAV